MTDRDKPANHWDEVYRTRAETDVSWFQASADLSLELIEKAGAARSAPVLDVGAGASTLVDGLLERGFEDVTLLDIASTAFDAVRARIGKNACCSSSIRWSCHPRHLCRRWARALPPKSATQPFTFGMFTRN